MAADDERVILCLDINSFFLAVHERDDASLRDVPVALWQYNDVVCANPLARALGVSHYCKRHLEDVLSVATEPVALNQVNSTELNWTQLSTTESNSAQLD